MSASPVGHYYGQFADIAPCLVLLERIKQNGLDREAEVCLILPPHVLPGVTQAYGLDVIRENVARPTLGISPI